jgi:cytidylate kinase
MIVAIDGPAASGKGTLARKLAQHFELNYLDTGLLYRAVGALVLAQGKDASDTVVATQAAEALTPADLDRGDLRSEAAAIAASKVAAIPEVRAALLAFQQDFAAMPPGAVLDGRDIGTVVCPMADAKIFLLASPEVRARRRVKELQTRGEEVIYTAVLSDLRARDERDSGRSTAPLKPASDAICLDTDDLNAEMVFKIAVETIGEQIAAKRRGGT